MPAESGSGVSHGSMGHCGVSKAGLMQRVLHWHCCKPSCNPTGETLHPRRRDERTSNAERQLASSEKSSKASLTKAKEVKSPLMDKIDGLSKDLEYNFA